MRNEVNLPAIVKEENILVALSAEAKALCQEYQACGRKTADAAIKLGQVLIRLKESCPHGTWEKKVAEIFPGNKSTAERAMRAARKHEEAAQRPSETLLTMLMDEDSHLISSVENCKLPDSTQEIRPSGEEEEGVSKLDTLSNLDTPEEPPCAEESAVEKEQESSTEPTSEPAQQSISEPAVSQEEEHPAESEETTEPAQSTPEPTASPPLPEPSLVSAEPVQEEPAIAPTQPDGPEWYVRYEMRDGTVCTRNIIPRRLRYLECEYVIDAYDVEKGKEIVLSLIRVVSWHAEKPSADSPKPLNNGTPKKARRGYFKA